MNRFELVLTITCIVLSATLAYMVITDSPAPYITDLPSHVHIKRAADVTGLGFQPGQTVRATSGG